MTSSIKRNYELEEKLPLYALDALEEAEMKELDAYLQQVPEAAAEFKKLKDAADLLPHAAPLRSPPAAVKSAVLSHIKANPRAVPSDTAASKPKLRPQRPELEQTPPSAWESFKAWWRKVQAGPALPVALALSLITIGFISSRLFTAQGEVGRLNGLISEFNENVTILNEDLDELTAENESLQSVVENLESENDQLQTTNLTLLTRLEGSEQVVAYAADANSQRLALPGTEAQPSASGGLFIRPTTGELLLVISELEPLTDEQIYQLWLIEDQPMSAGLIEISPEGTGIFEIDVAINSIDFSAVGVSIEPAGGSELPTGDIVMFAKFSG